MYKVLICLQALYNVRTLPSSQREGNPFGEHYMGSS